MSFRCLIASTFALATLVTSTALANTQTELQRAHIVSAMTHYADEDYAASYTEFLELSRIGNANASAHLGIMTLEAQGTEYDPVKAWAYFKLSGEQGYQDGDAFAEEVYTQLSPEQQAATSNALERMQANLMIDHRTVRSSRYTPPRLTPIRRSAPRYPQDSARDGRIGFTEMRLLVDTDGSVSAVQTHFYSHPDFKSVSERAVRSWRYEPVDYPTMTHIHLQFSMSRHEDRSAKPYFDFLRDTLWQEAHANKPNIQSTLGFILRTLQSPSVKRSVNSERIEASAPNSATFQDQAILADFPANWTGDYWLTRAAQAGERAAQGSLAFENTQWRAYLLANHDESAMAWEAVRLLQQEDGHEQGRALIAQLEDSESHVVQNILRTIKPYYQQ